MRTRGDGDGSLSDALHLHGDALPQGSVVFRSPVSCAHVPELQAWRSPVKRGRTPGGYSLDRIGHGRSPGATRAREGGMGQGLPRGNNRPRAWWRGVLVGESWIVTPTCAWMNSRGLWAAPRRSRTPQRIPHRWTVLQQHRAPLRTLDGTVNCRALNSCSAIDRREKPYYCRLTSTRVPLTLAHFLFLSRAGQGECRFAIAESV